ncbi:MAG: hypothetical protein COY01_02880 [Candidatus Pacebacteria bacterium CG_4_10_14_0_2_um_filter_40_20]|nr:MAG: hypothetical protein COY01_02880 [Candidatus Pacebacteria bacterium CG_4_10_14_0_2_um_filter_40_20]
MKKKDYYTSQELIKEPWFPVKSGITIKKLIEQGELEAVNVSTSPDRKRYRVSRKSAEDFVQRRKSNKQ